MAAASRGWRWWRELILVAVFYEAYNFIQHLLTGSTARAMRTGHDILHIEQVLHLDPEHALNHVVDNVTILAVPACYIYTSLHFLITPAVLIWSHYKQPRSYARGRAVLAIMTLTEIGRAHV